jgi:hypothetical protein
MRGLPERIFSFLICCPKERLTTALSRTGRGVEHALGFEFLSIVAILNFHQRNDRIFVLQSGADGIERGEIRGHQAEQICNFYILRGSTTLDELLKF